jgi:prepilin-type processing-associated H-X9-DG protein
MIVTAIVGILTVILLPAIQASREAARRSRCASNLRDIGLALIEYADVHKRLPAATQFRPGKPFPQPVNGPGGTWVVEILPYIDEQAVYDQFDHTRASNHANNADVVGISLPEFICPSDRSAPPGGVFPTIEKQDGGNVNPIPTNGAEFVMGLWYPVSAGPTHFDGCPYCTAPRPNKCCQGQSFGSMPVNILGDPVGPPGTLPSFAGLFGRWEHGIKLTEITDGRSRVFMAGETIASHCKYQCAHCPNFPIAATNTPLNTFRVTRPTLAATPCSVGPFPNSDAGGYCEACGYKSRHPRGAHMLMADGTVRFIRDSIDFDLFAALGDRKSDEMKRLD